MKKNNNGFTIIELMFSTVTFSVVLLICLAGVIQIGRMYYKGLTTSQTQQTARGLLDEITQSIQLSGGGIEQPRSLSGSPGSYTAGPAPVGPSIAAASDPLTGALGFFCIGNTRYTYVIDRQQDNTSDGMAKKIQHVMWADELNQCAGAADINDLFTKNQVDLKIGVPRDGGRDVLADNMRITKLVIEPLNGDTDVWHVALTVAYGDDDLLITDPSDSSRRICRNTSVGGQFCAISELSTIVKRRISVQ